MIIISYFPINSATVQRCSGAAVQRRSGLSINVSNDFLFSYESTQRSKERRANTNIIVTLNPPAIAVVLVSATLVREAIAIRDSASSRKLRVKRFPFWSKILTANRYSRAFRFGFFRAEERTGGVGLKS